MIVHYNLFLLTWQVLFTSQPQQVKTEISCAHKVPAYLLTYLKPRRSAIYVRKHRTLLECAVVSIIELDRHQMVSLANSRQRGLEAARLSLGLEAASATLPRPRTPPSIEDEWRIVAPSATPASAESSSTPLSRDPFAAAAMSATPRCPFRGTEYRADPATKSWYQWAFGAPAKVDAPKPATCPFAKGAVALPPGHPVDLPAGHPPVPAVPF